MRTASPPPRAGQARVAGIRDFQTPTLEGVERRRWQLWIIAGFLICAFAAVVILFSLGASPLATIDGFAGYAIRVLFLGFSIGLALYLLEKESTLRDLTRALVNERVLSAALSNRLREVSLLSEVGKAINEVLDLQEVLRLIIDSAADLLHAEEGTVMLLDESGSNLVVAQLHSENQNAEKGKVIPIGSGIAGWVAFNKEPVLVVGKAQVESFPGLEEKEKDINSSVTVPLIGKGELLGVLSVNDLTGEREFSEYDLRALGLFAEHAAIAVRNARIHSRERLAVQSLAEADRLKTEFIATVSHELKTPLTSIIGAAKTLSARKSVLSEIDKDHLVTMIEKSSDRLLDMVEKVLAASLAEAGNSYLTSEELDLTEILRFLVRSFEVSCDNPINLNGPEGVTVFGDYNALTQVFSNLLDNACKYSGPAPITINMTQTPDWVTVEVADQGPGISEQDLPRVFDRFFRIDAGRKTTIGGAGLGLYIVKKFLDAQGGIISASSKPGAGTVFTVTLPRRGTA